MSDDEKNNAGIFKPLGAGRLQNVTYNSGKPDQATPITQQFADWLRGKPYHTVNDEGRPITMQAIPAGDLECVSLQRTGEGLRLEIPNAFSRKNLEPLIGKEGVNALQSTVTELSDRAYIIPSPYDAQMLATLSGQHVGQWQAKTKALFGKMQPDDVTQPDQAAYVLREIKPCTAVDKTGRVSIECPDDTAYEITAKALGVLDIRWSSGVNNMIHVSRDYAAPVIQVMEQASSAFRADARIVGAVKPVVNPRDEALAMIGQVEMNAGGAIKATSKEHGDKISLALQTLGISPRDISVVPNTGTVLIGHNSLPKVKALREEYAASPAAQRNFRPGDSPDLSGGGKENFRQ